jgi:hypothetical protein
MPMENRVNRTGGGTVNSEASQPATQRVDRNVGLGRQAEHLRGSGHAHGQKRIPVSTERSRAELHAVTDSRPRVGPNPALLQQLEYGLPDPVLALLLPVAITNGLRESPRAEAIRLGRERRLRWEIDRHARS